MFDDADRQFPGAVWSFSIGWGCDKLHHRGRSGAGAVGAERRRSRTARRRSTPAVTSRGWNARAARTGRHRRAPADVGLDSVASLPEMTDVGGTTLSTDGERRWLAEQAWFDVPLSLGTGGGVSALFDRPDWQRGRRCADRDPGKRLTPDVAAVADPFTGVRIVFKGQPTGRRRHLAVRADLGGAGRGDEPVPARQRRPAARRPQPACCTASPRARRCRRSATSRSAATRSTTPGRATTWSPASARPTSTTSSAIVLVLQKASDDIDRHRR